MRITEKIVLKATAEERFVHAAIIFSEIKDMLGDEETFNELGLTFMTRIEEDKEFYVMFGDDRDGMHTTRIQIKDSPAEAIDFVNTLPVKCERENYILVATLLNRINKTRFGAFRLDESDGSVTYNYSYCVFGEGFNYGYFLFYLRAIQKMSTDCLSGIKRVAIGELSEDEKYQFLSEVKVLADCLLYR